MYNILIYHPKMFVRKIKKSDFNKESAFFMIARFKSNFEYDDAPKYDALEWHYFSQHLRELQ